MGGDNMTDYKFKMSAATWVVAEIGPATESAFDRSMSEYSVGEWGHNYCVTRPNMVLEAGASLAVVKAEIKRNYLGEDHRKLKKLKPIFSFVRPAFLDLNRCSVADNAHGERCDHQAMRVSSRRSGQCSMRTPLMVNHDLS